MAYIDDPETQRANLGFIKSSMTAPLLSRDREFELATAWRDRGDIAALHELVRAYTRLVIAAAARFRNYGLPIGDLVQEGTIGLMQATARFDPDRDVRFSTYATWWIRSAMQDYVLRNWSIVRTGTTAAQKSLFFNLRRLRARIEEMSGEAFGESGRRQIAATLKVDITEVETMEQRLSANDQSLNAPLSEGGDENWQDGRFRPTLEEAVMSLRDDRRRSAWLAEALDELAARKADHPRTPPARCQCDAGGAGPRTRRVEGARAPAGIAGLAQAPDEPPRRHARRACCRTGRSGLA